MTDKNNNYSRLLIFVCLLSFFCYLGSFMRLPIVPLYARSLGMNADMIGYINSALFFMTGLLSFPLGMVSDRFGRKRMACSGLLLLAATSFSLCLAKTPLHFIVIYIFFGIGFAATGPTLMSFVADFSPSTHLGRSYGWYTTAIFSAMSIGPAAGGILAHSYGYNPAFIISGSIILLTFTTAVLFFPATPVSDTPFSRRNITRTVRMISSNPVLLAGWIVTLAGCFGRGMFNTFIPLYAQNQGLDARQIGFLFFSEGLVNALIRIPFGYISDKSGNRNLFIIIGMIGLAAAMTGYGFSTDLAVFILLSLLQGISMGVTFTSIGALIAESVAPEYRGVAMGGYNTCIYFGMMLSSAIMGNVILAVGFENAFFLTALVFLLSVAIFFLLTGIGRTVE